MRRGRSKGFSLLEVMMAMTIIAISLMAILSMITHTAADKEVQRELAYAMALALPMADIHSSRLLHEPVYDAKADQFDPPCKEPDFESSIGRCWRARESLPEVFRSWADHEAGFKLGLSSPRTGAVIPASDHLDIVTCPDSVNEPGLSVVRVSRVGEDRWHVYHWTCGLAPGASTMGLGIAGGKMNITLASDSGLMDPPLKAVDLAQDASLWTKRNSAVAERWGPNGHWRDALRLCTHPSK